MQKKPNVVQMIKLKNELYDEILNSQRKTMGTETLAELMAKNTLQISPNTDSHLDKPSVKTQA